MTNIKKKGSRAEVYHGNALMTTGGLMKKDLLKNKHGHIVSSKKVKHSKDPNKNPLLAMGLLAKRRSKKFGPNYLNNNSTKKSKENSKRNLNSNSKKSAGYFQPLINIFQ